MKALKKMSCLVLAFCLALGVFMVPTTSAEAASKAKVPKGIHIQPEVQQYLWVNYVTPGDKIKNLKSKSKGLIVKQTYQYTYSYYDKEDDYYDLENGHGMITLYAKEAGTYKFTFDIYSRAGKKKSSHTVTVGADYTPAISSITFAGTSLQYNTGRGILGKDLYTTKKKGKLSVKMTKGYKLKGVYIQTYNKKGEANNYKKVNLKKDITLGAYKSDYKRSHTTDSNNWRDEWSKSMYAATTIKVTYVDKYTKEEANEYFYIYRTK